MTKNNAFNNRCGKGRGCRIVELPFDDRNYNFDCDLKRGFISVLRIPEGSAPSWEVVRWDIDEPSRMGREAAG